MAMFIVSALACSHGSSPGDTMTKMLTFIDQGNYAEAAKLWAVPAGMEPKVSIGLMQVSSQMKERGGLSSVEIVKSTTDGDTAQVDFKTHMKKPDPADDAEVKHAKLVKTDNQWKLSLQQ